jgi:hypothetical protein
VSFRKQKITKQQQEKENLPLNQRLQTITDEYAKIKYDYKLTEKDKRELWFEKWKKTFSGKKVMNPVTDQEENSYQYDLQRIYRIKMPTSNKEYYTYRILERVIDNANQWHDFSRHVGYHETPIGQFHQNEYGEVDDTNIQNWKITYELDWNPEELKKLIEGSNSTPNSLAVGKGVTVGKGRITSGSPNTVWNLRELLEKPFDSLIGASQDGFLKMEYGGCEEWEEAQVSELKERRKERAEQQARIARPKV